jgi:Protein of unknown function (DUF3179)
MCVLLTALALLVAGTTAGCSLGDDDGAAGRAKAADELRVSTSEWDTDFSKHNVPLGEFQSGGPGRDGIPPIDKPKPVSQAEAEDFLDDREPVLVVEQSDAVRAYPIQILIWHEIVNDELGGRPIAVTYCPLCNSSVVFDRRVEGRELTFGTTGNLRNSDLVMWDRQTESWWQQLTAEAVVGELTGTKLEVLPSQTLSWADFKRAYPEGNVLSRDTGSDRPYGSNPYEGYDRPEGQPLVRQGGEALRANERVAAVFAADEALVVPFSRLAREPVVNEQVGGEPVVFLYKRGVVSPLDAPGISDSRDVGTATAFGRRVDGRELSFERRGGAIVDRQTGSEWDITGRAVAGELRGERLPRVRHDEQFWFALAAFLPDARIVG